MRTVCNFWMLGVIILSLWLLNISSVLANSYDVSSPSTLQLSEELTVIKSIGKPISLSQAGLECWGIAPEKTLFQEHLIETTKHLRDIARHLGSGWPIFLPTHQAFQELTHMDFQTSQYKIIAFKDIDENWVFLTVGQVLDLIVEELQILKNKQKQPLIDFLLMSQNDNFFHPMVGASLSCYCYEVIKEVQPRSIKKFH